MMCVKSITGAKQNKMLHYLNPKYPLGSPPEDKAVLWRCEVKRYSVVIDAELELYGTSDPQIELTWWEILRKTPKGHRLWCGKFVNSSSRKKWAATTQLEAIKDCLARRRRCLTIYQHRAQSAHEEVLLLQALVTDYGKR